MSRRVDLPLLLYPQMHAALRPVKMPEEVRCLDPGLFPEDDPLYWRPADLPLPHREAVGHVRSFERLASEVRDARELRTTWETEQARRYDESRMGIQASLVRSARGTGKKEDRELRIQAQLVLLLAAMLQRDDLEAAHIEATVWAKQSRLEELLQDGEETLFEPAQEETGGGASHSFPTGFSPLFEAFLVFLPSEAALVTISSELLLDIEEMGMLRPIDPELQRNLEARLKTPVRAGWCSVPDLADRKNRPLLRLSTCRRVAILVPAEGESAA